MEEAWWGRQTEKEQGKEKGRGDPLSGGVKRERERESGREGERVDRGGEEGGGGGEGEGGG